MKLLGGLLTWAGGIATGAGMVMLWQHDGGDAFGLLLCAVILAAVGAWVLYECE